MSSEKPTLICAQQILQKASEIDYRRRDQVRALNDLLVAKHRETLPLGQYNGRYYGFIFSDSYLYAHQFDDSESNLGISSFSLMGINLGVKVEPAPLDGDGGESVVELTYPTRRGTV